MTSQPVWSHTPLLKPTSFFQKVIAVLAVFALAYLAARVGGVLVLRPQMVWPLWPGCALVVAILLMTPRKMWPVLLLAGLAGFCVYDAKSGLGVRTTACLLIADFIEILVASVGVSYAFRGTPRLNSVRALAKYAFWAIFLAPIAVASTAAVVLPAYSWSLGFLTESLALLTLTPAILGWVNVALTPDSAKRRYPEATLMFAGLTLCAYIAFVVPGSGEWPVLLYALLPFLLWASLRLGITGASTSAILVAFFAVLGAIRGRGPFTGGTPLHDVLSLQVFLLFAASSFIVLAAVVEQDKTAEQAVRESERRFRLLADSAPSLMWMSGTDKLCTYFNKTWLEFTGRSFEQEYGNGWTEGVHPDDLQKCLETYTQSFDRREKFAMEYRLRRRDGQYRWIYDIGVPRFNEDGSFAGYIGIVVDVTERKHAEEALSESEEKFRSIFRDAGVGMVIVSPEGRYLAANRTFCDYLGYTEDELLTTTVQAITFPEDWPTFSQALNDTLTRGRSFQWVQKRCLHKSGRIVYTETSASVIRNGAGHPEYFVAEVLDITSRKQAEEALSNVNRRLIEAQEQERTRIARELHDDINQRLALLAVELEAARQKLPDSADDMRLLLEAVRDRIQDTSFDLQSISHQLHSSKLEYLGIVAAIKSFCNERSSSHNIEIDFSHDDIPGPVSHEVSLALFRVLQEALQNAVKHSHVRYFEVELNCSNSELHLRVSDRGVGFDTATALKQPGLGLISMQERVRLVNGTIAIKSKPMGGTTVDVHVPFTVASDEEQAAG